MRLLAEEEAEVSKMMSGTPELVEATMIPTPTTKAVTRQIMKSRSLDLRLLLACTLNHMAVEADIPALVDGKEAKIRSAIIMRLPA